MAFEVALILQFVYLFIAKYLKYLSTVNLLKKLYDQSCSINVVFIKAEKKTCNLVGKIVREKNATSKKKNYACG